MSVFSLIVFLIMSFGVFSCLESGSSLRNEAQIKITKPAEASEGIKMFPDIPSDLRLKLNEVTAVSGSYGSIDMAFSDSIDGVTYTLKIQLTGRGKTQLHNRRWRRIYGCNRRITI